MEGQVSKNICEVIFKEGDPSDALYIVKRGQVVCLKSSRDRLIPIYRAGEGDLIGENAILGGEAYGYSAITLTPVELVKIPSKSFKAVLESAPDWLHELTGTMVERFQNTANLIADNRLFNEAILEEGEYPSSDEVQYKKLLNQ